MKEERVRQANQKKKKEIYRLVSFGYWSFDLINSRIRKERERERGGKNYKIKEKGLLPDGSIFVCSLIRSFYVVCACVCEESSHRSFSADANLS